MPGVHPLQQEELFTEGLLPRVLPFSAEASVPSEEARATECPDGPREAGDPTTLTAPATYSHHHSPSPETEEAENRSYRKRLEFSPKAKG